MLPPPAAVTTLRPLLLAAGCALLVPCAAVYAQAVAFSGPYAINAFETPTGIVDLFCEDLDGDGDMDALAHLRASSLQPGSFMKFLNGGDGVFDSGTSFGELDSLHHVILGDINRDASPDIVAMTADSIYWWENIFGPSGRPFVSPITVTVPGESAATSPSQSSPASGGAAPAVPPAPAAPQAPAGPVALVTEGLQALSTLVGIA